MIGLPFPTLEEMPYNPTMSKNRIISVVGLIALVPLAVWAQNPGPATAPSAPPPASAAPAPAPGAQRSVPGSTAAPGLPQAPPLAPGAPPAQPTTPAEPPTEAETFLDGAIKKLQALQSVSADVTQKVDMLAQHFEIKGQYIKAPNYRIYLKLTLSGLGDSSGTWLQVCDGATLWDYQQLLTDRHYQRLQIDKILKKVDVPDFDPEIRKQMLERFGFSGPDALLVGLRKSVKFERMEPETLDGRPVLVLRGNWKDLAALAGPNQQPLSPTAPLPAYIPSVVVVWIGQDDGWPYKVSLEGRVPSVLEDTRQLDMNGRPVGRKGGEGKVEASKIVLFYENVKLNPTVQPELFHFEAPPEAPVSDVTDGILVYLEQAAAIQAEQKTAEAAREGLELQPIRVPKPATDSPPPVENITPQPK
jgi:outer membrane lipoprotein-sorting protein